MGGRFSHVHYREQDAAVLPPFVLLTQVWGLDEIALLSTKLRRISFNFCLSFEQFSELLALRNNALFHTLLRRWFTAFQNTRQSTVVNGLEFLTALALASADGSAADKAAAVFAIFDFDDSLAITLDELCILLKSAVRGLAKLTRGLGPRLVALCPMHEINALARQCFQQCDLEDEQDLARDVFVQWVTRTPKIVTLVRCFVQREFLSDDEAAVAIQRCFRGMVGRSIAATLRCEQQLALEHEITQAALTIQDAVVTHKKRRDTLRQAKLDKFAHHGALYTCGANARGQLAHAQFELEKQLVAPLLSQFFKHNELRVTAVAISTVHAAAVTSNGHVYTWGSGVPSAFGWLSARQTRHKSDNVTTTSKSNPLVNSYVHKVPTRVDDLDDVTIVAVALGTRHSAALSDRGAVYTWGAGSFGQLGHGALDTFTQQFDPHTGSAYPYIDLPLQLDTSWFEEARVSQVACGYYCTVAVCDDGSVFTWGDGSDGQLGLGFTDAFHVGALDAYVHGSSFVYMPSPTRVDALTDPIGSVAIGGNHVFAVTRDHRNVYEWGAWLRRGADSARDSAFAPQRHAELSALYVDAIAAGQEHALATVGRVEVTVKVDNVGTVRAFGLCARFGAQPTSLVRALSGSVVLATSSSASRLDGTDDDASIRSSLSQAIGRVVYVDRGASTGSYVSIRDCSTGAIVDVPCVSAAFGPILSSHKIRAQLFYSPEKLRSLRLYVRPEQVVGTIVVLAFGADDFRCLDDAADDIDALALRATIDAIMHVLVDKAKDAQVNGAAAVVILFDVLDADAFALELAADEVDEFVIPVVMVRGRDHGELVLDAIARDRNASATLSFKLDVLGQQILMAQKLGAKAIVVGQNRIEQTPVRLQKDIFATDAAQTVDATTGIKLPIVMVSYEAGKTIKAKLKGIDIEDSVATVGLTGFGHVYAWGYAENGRLGLGDTENDAIFETGFDSARQTSYPFVSAPEPVLTLFDTQVTHIACGEEHSTAVTSEGKLYCWGSGRDGKLGTGVSDDEYVPVEIASLASVRAAQTACGPHQTFVVTHNPSLKSGSSR